jgi:hypothetical protein
VNSSAGLVPTNALLFTDKVSLGENVGYRHGRRDPLLLADQIRGDPATGVRSHCRGALVVETGRSIPPQTGSAAKSLGQITTAKASGLKPMLSTLDF